MHKTTILLRFRWGTEKKTSKFAYMLEMHYELIGIGLVKMMVGVKRTGEKVQYSITAIKA